MLTIESPFTEAGTLGSSPINLYPVPEDSEFEGYRSGFIEAPKLADIARRLIKACGERFAHLNGVSIAYAWKRKGGVSKGRSKFGAIQKVSGVASFLGDEQYQFLIWLGADNVRENEFTERQVEALIYHELCHTVFDDERDEVVLVGHEFEGFRDELQRYGLWNKGIEHFGRAVAEPIQQSLFELGESYDGTN